MNIKYKGVNQKIETEIETETKVVIKGLCISLYSLYPYIINTIH